MDLFLAFLVLANFCVGFLRAQLFAPKCKVENFGHMLGLFEAVPRVNGISLGFRFL